jgi:hypothetical protein
MGSHVFLLHLRAEALTRFATAINATSMAVDQRLAVPPGNGCMLALELLGASPGESSSRHEVREGARDRRLQVSKAGFV